MPGRWRLALAAAPRLWFQDFNLRRDARLLATALGRLPQRQRPYFNLRRDARFLATSEHPVYRSLAALISISGEMLGPWRPSCIVGFAKWIHISISGEMPGLWRQSNPRLM